MRSCPTDVKNFQNYGAVWGKYRDYKGKEIKRLNQYCYTKQGQRVIWKGDKNLQHRVIKKMKQSQKS